MAAASSIALVMAWLADQAMLNAQHLPPTIDWVSGHDAHGDPSGSSSRPGLRASISETNAASVGCEGGPPVRPVLEQIADCLSVIADSVHGEDVKVEAHASKSGRYPNAGWLALSSASPCQMAAKGFRRREGGIRRP